MPDPGFIPQKLKPWIEARKRFHLSHAHIQMARELGMNPKKLGKLNNHKQEPWKLPLSLFIENCYFKQFRKERPDDCRPIEVKAAEKRAKKAAKRDTVNSSAQAEEDPF
jgi:hypothetical protein